jgi:hypothetical protein
MKPDNDFVNRMAAGGAVVVFNSGATWVEFPTWDLRLLPDGRLRAVPDDLSFWDGNRQVVESTEDVWVVGNQLVSPSGDFQAVPLESWVEGDADLLAKELAKHRAIRADESPEAAAVRRQWLER